MDYIAQVHAELKKADEELETGQVQYHFQRAIVLALVAIAFELSERRAARDVA